MNLLELALEQIHNKDQWYDGEVVTIWENGHRRAWVKNESGFLNLFVFQDNDEQTRRFWSQPLVVGYFDPEGQLWQESEWAERDYLLWATQTKRRLEVAR